MWGDSSSRDAAALGGATSGSVTEHTQEENAFFFIKYENISCN